MKIQRVVLHRQGAPDVMKIEESELDAPGPGEAQIEQVAIGLNYMDVYQRSGAYRLDLPSQLGLEAAGRVVAVGEDVNEIGVGDRVVYSGLLGAYATHRNAPVAKLVKIPDGISEQVAAAVLMKGMTVEYLLNRAYPVAKGQHVLFFAASGGVGQLAGQWGKHLGAHMIGVTSGADNCEAIRLLGYDVAIDRKTEDITARVLECTNGAGVPVVFDSVGAATFKTSIACLATFGMLVSFGATTGEAPPVPPSLLQKSGSLYFTRPTLADYVKTREDLLASSAEVFRLILAGVLKVNINLNSPLSDVVEAHLALEAGETTGSTIFSP